MKRFTLIYTFLLAVALPLITACYNDDNIITPQDGKVTVRLRISQAGAAVTRADSDDENLKDPNANTDELMNVWTVVITDNDGNVKHILTCEPADNDREIDPIETDIELTTGTYHFYSFANISPEYVKYLLGITSQEPTVDETFTDVKQGDIIDIPATGIITLDAAKAKTIAINGNGFNIAAENNGFLSKGIPMSNVQTITVTQPEEGKDAQVIDLIVVRLLAKIELEITNSGADDVTITSIVLTDITKNANDNDNKANLKLFPNYTAESPNGANEKVKYEHGDIKPNLTDAATTDVLEITSSTSGVTVSPSDQSDQSDQSNLWTIAKDATTTFTFYVNESQTPASNPKNNYNHFFLKINLSKTDGTDTQTEERYALIDDNGTQDNEKWDYIARNDYRIIPIELDDYKLELIPYDFPAIGVYPASVKEEDGLYTITFHDYGHFHLLPKVTKFTTTETKTVSYGTNGWSMNGSFANSWKSWESYEKSLSEQSTNNPGGFYAATANVANDDGSASINDDNDAGGIPVWYDNGASVTSWNKPQWNPADDTDYEPFIFGYIADPGANIKNGDKKVYHEFTIKVNTNHLLTYRLYMILDQDQMLYRTRALDAPAARHTHHWPRS